MIVEHGDYLSAWSCKHTATPRPLPNGEAACDICMSVIRRKDGTAVSWAPARAPWTRHLPMSTTAPTPVFEDVPLAAPKKEEPPP